MDINKSSIIMSNVNNNDYPDFVDAYIEYAENNDGIELSDKELEKLNENTLLLNEQAFEHFINASDNQGD